MGPAGLRGCVRGYTPGMKAVRDRTDLRPLAEALAAEPDVLLAITFGSLAQGRARFESDADVAVLAARPLAAERRDRIAGEGASSVGWQHPASRRSALHTALRQTADDEPLEDQRQQDRRQDSDHQTCSQQAVLDRELS